MKLKFPSSFSVSIATSTKDGDPEVIHLHFHLEKGKVLDLGLEPEEAAALCVGIAQNLDVFGKTKVKKWEEAAKKDFKKQIEANKKKKRK